MDGVVLRPSSVPWQPHPTLRGPLWQSPRDDSYLAVPLSWGPEAR
jgi:hypothetical protein